MPPSSECSAWWWLYPPPPPWSHYMWPPITPLFYGNSMIEMPHICTVHIKCMIVPTYQTCLLCKNSSFIWVLGLVTTPLCHPNPNICPHRPPLLFLNPCYDWDASYLHSTHQVHDSAYLSNWPSVLPTYVFYTSCTYLYFLQKIWLHFEIFLQE